MKKPELKLSDIRSVMEETYRHIGKVTGHADIDPAQEQRCHRVVPTPKREATNEEVLVCWGAVSAASSADVMTQDDFDAGLLLTGHAEPEVTGAIILVMCDRLLKVGVEAGAFPNVRVPLAMLASSIIPDMSDDDRCGHA
jgi:hypothetical protein